MKNQPTKWQTVKDKRSSEEAYTRSAPVGSRLEMPMDYPQEGVAIERLHSDADGLIRSDAENGLLYE